MKLITTLFTLLFVQSVWSQDIPKQVELKMYGPMGNLIASQTKDVPVGVGEGEELNLSVSHKRNNQTHRSCTVTFQSDEFDRFENYYFQIFKENYETILSISGFHSYIAPEFEIATENYYCTFNFLD
ncbi:MAG: hypothetical protein ACPGJV_09930 [Bacteriovoracaceae bacterium]